MADATDRSARRAELAANLTAVQRRIELAALAARRPSDAVTLVAVTKTYPADDIALLAELGVTDVGESRVQEASAKFEGLSSATSVSWHLIGQLQRNKVNAALRWADVIESVDRIALVEPLARAATNSEKVVDVLVQVDLDDTDRLERGGVRPADVAQLAAAIASTESLRLAGVMAVAPLGVDAARAFDRLAQVRGELLVHHPEATLCSAGMSGDLEQAVSAGATHVRIGTALLGSRPAVGYGA